MICIVLRIDKPVRTPQTIAEKDPERFGVVDDTARRDPKLSFLEIEESGLRDQSTPHELKNASSDILSVTSGIPAYIRLFPHN